VESEEMTSVHKGFAKTLAAVNPQLKFLEPCSDFHQGQESCSCDFVWMWPAPGLQLALCLLTLEKKSPASLQELKYGDLQTGEYAGTLEAPCGWRERRGGCREPCPERAGGGGQADG